MTALLQAENWTGQAAELQRDPDSVLDNELIALCTPLAAAVSLRAGPFEAFGFLEEQ